MAMQVHGTMTVGEFVKYAIKSGAKLHSLNKFTNGNGEDYQRRILSIGDKRVVIPGENDDSRLLHVEEVEYLKFRLGL